jgi:intracellular septation protein
MQLLFDFFPIIVFYLFYKLQGFFAATVAIIVAMAVQISIQWLTKRTVSKMLLISGGLVALLGGISLWLQDPVYLQWKVTIASWLFGAAFLASHFIGKKTLVERVLEHAVQLERPVWLQLNLIWVGNFLFLGAANLYVMHNYDMDTWVNFKLYGVLGISFLTALGQALIIAKHLPEEPEKES